MEGEKLTAQPWPCCLPWTAVCASTAGPQPGRRKEVVCDPPQQQLRHSRWRASLEPPLPLPPRPPGGRARILGLELGRGPTPGAV